MNRDTEQFNYCLADGEYYYAVVYFEMPFWLACFICLLRYHNLCACSIALANWQTHASSTINNRICARGGKLRMVNFELGFLLKMTILSLHEGGSSEW